MNPLKFTCLFVGILAMVSANPTASGRIPSRVRANANSIKHSYRATDMIPVSVLESLPSMHEMTFEKLEEMSVREGAEWYQKMYHLSQAGQAVEPTYAPIASEIPAYYVSRNNKVVNIKLNELPKVAMDENFVGNQEVTVYITGLPEKIDTVKKATRKLVEAYMQRYKGQSPKTGSVKYEDVYGTKKNSSSSEESEENEDETYKADKPSGNLVVVDVGSVIDNIHKYVTLDVEKTGIEIAHVLIQITNKANVPHEIIHVIGSNIGAHVAGAVGRHFTGDTGHQLRRITGLDPSRIFASTDNALKGLARGDAEFVDVIHTSAYGMGTPTRSGDADFYPNGPSEGVPGADNIVEASMRAVRYYAESVVPGNERNFPAVRATSMKQYKDQQGTGKRVYMGLDADYDIKGDYMLQVNPKSPFGRRSPAQKQRNYHNVHKPWKMSPRED